MKKENGFFIDENNNAWDCLIETFESATKKSKSLKNCRNCRDCSYCSDCSDFKINPQRITSQNIGSRNAQTTIYWTDEKEQVVCGCFKGTISEFKEQVQKTHNGNVYAKQYFDFIEKVEKYQMP
jgi:hypothetical protein